MCAGPPDEGKGEKSNTIVHAEARIQQALMSLGLTFSVAAQLVKYDPDADTAFWRHNRATGEESIHIGPRIASLSQSSIAMVLRHEILHRSMYHGFGERFEHAQLSNLVLDVFINHLLAEAYPDDFPRACKDIYPPESKTTPVALADCSAQPEVLSPLLKELWNLIWKAKQRDLPAKITPPSLYYRLIKLGSFDLRWNPFGCDDPNGNSPAYPSDAMARAAGKILEDIARHLPPNSSHHGTLEEFSVIPAPTSTANVENFMRRLRLRRRTDELARKITEPLRTGVRIQPYPMFPTRLGLMYQLLGLSELYTLYWNQEVAYQGSRLALGIYLDVSGSMVPYFPLVAAIADALSEYPLRFKVFDDSLRPGDLEDLAAGRIKGGGGTNFELPLRDLVQDSEIVAGLLCTDAEGTVDPGLGKELKMSKKKLYVVMFGKPGMLRGNMPLTQYATETISFDKPV